MTVRGKSIKSFPRLPKPDKQGMSAGVNIRESLQNANTATSNLAEAAEALKHNFFLRGFFKKRGYFTLTDLSPEKYRRDRAFTSRTNRRAWLSGSELFQNGLNGEEELSAKGKALLDATLAEYGDSMIESPIVIEGYWNGGFPADQLRLSRSPCHAGKANTFKLASNLIRRISELLR